MIKTLQVRLPSKLRDEAALVVEDMGLDLPTAVRLYLTKVVQTRSIPFTVEAPGVRVKAVEVDAALQSQMDAVASAWKKARSRKRNA
jgi:DNA-damage-inducible protein J